MMKISVDKMLFEQVVSYICGGHSSFVNFKEVSVTMTISIRFLVCVMIQKSDLANS